MRSGPETESGVTGKIRVSMRMATCGSWIGECRIGWSSWTPRTGDQREYLYPDPRNGNHEILIDPSGLIWLPEHRGRTGDKEKRLLGFNPATETFEHQIPMDPDNVVRNPTKFMQSLAMDSKGNIYVGWIMGGALSKWDRATGEVSVFRIPTPHAISLRRRGRSQRQYLDCPLERRQDRQVRYVQQFVDRVHGADLPRAHAAAECRLTEQRLVGHLFGWPASREARQAGPGHGQDDRVDDPAAKRRTLRCRRRSPGQHLVRRRGAANRRRVRSVALEVRPAQRDVHVLSETAAAR